MSGEVLSTIELWGLFFEGSLNGERYTTFLQDELNDLLDAIVPVNKKMKGFGCGSNKTEHLHILVEQPGKN
jgi:hypothetical protein